MLKEKVVYVCCGPQESLWHSAKESVGMDNEEERNTITFGWISDETV